VPTSQPLSADAITTLKGLLDPALETIDKAIDLMGEDAVIAYLNALYDKHVSPLDIPYVPDTLEGVVDSLAKTAIARLVRVGHAAIHKTPVIVPSPPMPAVVVLPPSTGATP
jgi:hypothetical protein